MEKDSVVRKSTIMVEIEVVFVRLRADENGMYGFFTNTSIDENEINDVESIVRESVENLLNEKGFDVTKSGPLESHYYFSHPGDRESEIVAGGIIVYPMNVWDGMRAVVRKYAGCIGIGRAPHIVKFVT